MQTRQGLQADLASNEGPGLGALAGAEPGGVDGSALRAWVPADWHVAPDWRPTVQSFFAGSTGHQLGAFIQARLAAGATIYPAQPLHALALTPRHAVRVVIVGQDPYHGPGQAHGLAFSVPSGIKPPPSLRNILQEIARDPALTSRHPIDPHNGSLARWAEQGVLLLNTCLTVEAGRPASHARQGWEALTDALLVELAAGPVPLVFMLWGAHAQARAAQITHADSGHARHLILQANHPSPLSARRAPVPFIGCAHFSRANAFLAEHLSAPICW